MNKDLEFLHMDIQMFQHHLYKRLSFLHWITYISVKNKLSR